MPTTRVLIYAEEDGTAPLLDWLDAQPTKVQDKVFVREGRAVLSHGCKKERRVPERALDVARQRLARFRTAPDKHTYRE